VIEQLLDLSPKRQVITASLFQIGGPLIRIRYLGGGTKDFVFGW
jgi:hypothetical protein